MLNKVGGLHCGACGELLVTADHSAVPDDAPLSADDGGNGDEGVNLRVPGVPEVTDDAGAGNAADGLAAPAATTMALRLNMFGEPTIAEEEAEGEDEVSAHQTIMGMRLVPAEPRAHPFSSGGAAHKEEPMLLARAVGASEEQFDRPESPSPETHGAASEPEAAPSGSPPAQFQTLFGMRAAEMQLGAQAAQPSGPPAQAPDVPDRATPPPLPPESFEEVEDTSDFEVIRSSELDAVVEEAASSLGDMGEVEDFEDEAEALLPPQPPAAKPASSVKGLDPALLEPATIPVAESITHCPPTPLPAPVRKAKPPPVPRMAAARQPSGPREHARPSRSASRPAPPARRSRRGKRSALRPVPAGARILQLVAGLALLGSSFLPLSESVWASAGRGINLLVDLAPIALGLVTIALAIPTAVPSLERAVLGLSAVAVGAFILADAGTAPFRAGGAVAMRFSLIALGCVLLFILGLLQLSSSSVEPTAPKPPD